MSNARSIKSRGCGCVRRAKSAMIATTEIIEFATVQPAFEAEGRRLGMQPEELGFDLFTMAMEYARDLNQREPSVAGDDLKTMGLDALRRQADRLEGQTVEMLRAAMRAGDARARMDLVDVLARNMLRVRDTDRRPRADIVEEYNNLRHGAEGSPGCGRSHVATAIILDAQVDRGALAAARAYPNMLLHLENAAYDCYVCPALLYLPKKVASAGLFRPSEVPHLVRALLLRGEEFAAEQAARVAQAVPTFACAGPGCSISVTRKAQLFKCPLCRDPHYCSDACFDLHWRGGHKEQCAGKSAPK